MTAFIRRFREVPTTEELLRIETIAIVDATPTTPNLGLGAGAMLLVGEFEDGPFNEPTEVFGINDERRRFGGFGYSYGESKYQNPSARRRNLEDWNGNGYLKGKFLRPPRKIIVRVDTSVGFVELAPLAARFSNEGPFRLEVGDQLTIAYNGNASATTTAVAAAPALVAGSGFAGTSGYAGGEQIGIKIDANPEVIVSFAATDSTPAQVAAKINTFLGYNAAVENAGEVDITGIIQGTDGEVVLRDVTPAALAGIGHTAGGTSGTGNVGDLRFVSSSEIAALGAGGTGGTVEDSEGRVVYRTEVTPTGTVNVSPSAMATRLGLTTGISAPSNQGSALRIPAGLRVEATSLTGSQWVTMQSIDLPEGTSANPNPATIVARIRPANDIGTEVAAAPLSINTLIDQPGGDRFWIVLQTDAVVAALDEDDLDQRYEQAFASTIDITAASRDATVSLSARRSDAINRAGRLNAIQASDEGNRGRVFHTRARFSDTPEVARVDVAANRSDRVNYCYPGWVVRVPEIAEVGTAGGIGFTADGIITIGADGPLAYLNCALPPEENTGQDTGRLGFVFGIEAIEGVTFDRELYESFKAAGICAPRVDRRGVPVYQSEVTTDLTPGRTTQKRRKMADFIQDSLAVLLLPFSKKLATDSREAGIDAAFDDFLGNLLSEDRPENQRIRDYQVVNTNTENPTLLALGISSRRVRVQLLSSLDSFLVDTEIGEGVVIVRDAA